MYIRYINLLSIWSKTCLRPISNVDHLTQTRKQMYGVITGHNDISIIYVVPDELQISEYAMLI